MNRVSPTVFFFCWLIHETLVFRQKVLSSGSLSGLKHSPLHHKNRPLRHVPDELFSVTQTHKNNHSQFKHIGDYRKIEMSGTIFFFHGYHSLKLPLRNYRTEHQIPTCGRASKQARGR